MSDVDVSDVFRELWAADGMAKQTSEYCFDVNEELVLQYYLQIGKQYLKEICDPQARDDAERLRQYHRLIEAIQGKRGVSKPHRDHSVFTVADVRDYYADGRHALAAGQRQAVADHFRNLRPTRFYVTIDCIAAEVARDLKAGKYGRLTERCRRLYSHYSAKRIKLEVTYAARRLAVRGFAVGFPGTPRFAAGAVSVDIPVVQAAIRAACRVEPPEPKPVPEQGLLHDVQLPADVPPDYPEGTSRERIEAEVDGEIEDHDRAMAGIVYVNGDTGRAYRLSDLTEDQRFVIEHARAEAGGAVNLQYLLELALRSPRGSLYHRKTLYMRLYRAARQLEKIGLVSIKKGVQSPIFTGIDQKGEARSWSDGLLWVVLDQSRVHAVIASEASEKQRQAPEKTDLIKGYYEIPTDVIRPAPAKKRRDPYAIPKHCGALRRSAIYFLQGVNSLDLAENTRDRVEHRHYSGPYHDMQTLMDKFRVYQDDTLRKIIKLMNTITGEVIGFDYSTRFNDFAKGIERLKKYEYAQDRSLEDFDECVFVTLTTDPSKFPNLWTANRHSPRAWNTFAQILTAEPTLGDRKHRLKYIIAFEYTKTGLLHIHALIFGRRYLHSPKHKEEERWISDKWNNSCGQGRIVRSYGLRRVTCQDGHREWQWYSAAESDRPHDAGKMSGGEYLKKYLKKCMMAITDRYEDPSSTLAPYWAENKRFWSCSRSFMPEHSEDGAPEEAPAKPASRYAFMAIEYGTDVVEAADAGMIDRIAYRRYDPERDGAAGSGGASP